MSILLIVLKACVAMLLRTTSLPVECVYVCVCLRALQLTWYGYCLPSPWILPHVGMFCFNKTQQTPVSLRSPGARITLSFTAPTSIITVKRRRSNNYSDTYKVNWVINLFLQSLSNMLMSYNLSVDTYLLFYLHPNHMESVFMSTYMRCYDLSSI